MRINSISSDFSVKEKVGEKMSTVAKIMSFPPLKTSHFNPDGTNKFSSKLQICVFCPSVMIMIVLFLVAGVPLLSDAYTRSEIEV